MVQRIRYFKTDNAENGVSDEQLRSCKHELEVEPFPAPARQQGLALLLSLQQTPQLKGHSLEIRAPLGQSTIWRPLQEIRVVPQGVLDIKAVKGKQRCHTGPAPESAELNLTQAAYSRPPSAPLMYRRTSSGGTKLSVLKEVPSQLS
ncbi:hypothetical protein ABBQ38_005276 [Trebouxia sp. C0009 RCD-2024]